MAALQAAVRSAMRGVDAGWGCLASADGDSFVVRPAVGAQTTTIPREGSFFAHVHGEGEVVVATREHAEAFADTRLIDFSPGVLVGIRLGDDDVLVVADVEERVLGDADLAALLDVARAARELVAAERRADGLSRQLFDASPDAMLVVAHDGRIVRVNRTAETLLGYGAGELSAKTIDLVPRAARAGHARKRVEYSAAPSPRQMGSRANLSAVRRDGTEVPVDIMLGAFATGDDTHVLAVLRDMTAREDALAAIRAAEEQLCQSQRLEQLGRLAASIAHDFNNVLTVVSSCSELMLTEADCPPSMVEEMRDVRSAAERGGLLTRQLLAFAREDAPQRRAIGVGDVCHALGPLLQRLIGSPYHLELRVEPDLGPIFADPVHIEQILMNLVVNARDAMPSGGTIDLVVERVHVGSDVAGTEPGAYIAIEVTDTGSGIAPDVLARIFEPLFTTKPAERGTGLGLAIVHRVVTASGGKIRVETEVGRGTTLTVLFPEVADLSLARPKRTPSVVPRGIRVLVVDDEPVNRRVIAAILTRGGYDVIDAASADAALALGRTSPPDLLVTDVSMLGTSGPALVSSLRSVHPGLRAVFVTGNPALCREEAERCAVADVPVVQKPFSVESLTMEVEAALAAHAV